MKHKYLAEIVGTFIFVYAIASAATVYSDSGQLGVIGIALVHELVLTAIIYAIEYLSGAQVNPAVTIGLLVARKIGGKEAVLYNMSVNRRCIRCCWCLYGVWFCNLSQCNFTIRE